MLDMPSLSAGFLSAGMGNRLTKKKTKHDTKGLVNPKLKVSDISTSAEQPMLSHEQLIQNIAAHRDKAAFGVLFEHFAPRVKSYLIKLGMGAVQAEDLVQDIMVTVWQKAALFKPDRAKVSTWIFRIARNKFIDLTRKQKYPEVNADDHMADLVATDQTDKSLDQKQTGSNVAQAMSKLNTDQQKVIKLSFFEEMSHSEIAKHLAVPLGTVKSRIRLAFQVLRKELGDAL